MKKDYTIEMNEVAVENKDKISIATYQQDDLAPHAHHFFELAYITGGSAEHTLNGVTGMVSAGDYFVVDYGSVHSYAGSKDFTLINCLFLPEVIDDTLADCHAFDELLRVCLIRYYNRYFAKNLANQIFRDESGRIKELLLGMQEEYIQKRVGYMEIFRGRLMEILILTMRKVVQEDSCKENRKSPQSTAVLEAIWYMNRNYQERAVLGCFCQEYHYSPQYISRRFKQETGMTVLEYLQKVRIEKSCELLSGSDFQIQEIAQLVGYEDVKFFNIVFRRFLKMTPREYRKLELTAKG